MSDDLRPIDLAHAEPFGLGTLEVRPATREVVAGHTRELLQPRIMQVLVALTRGGGVVVSRDDLIRLCWDGQVVGDDAVHRCIARLRQLGDAHDAFDVETIPRIGYRLAPRPSSAPAGAALHGAGDPHIVLAVLPFENLSSDSEMQFFS